jgi:predicted transcriptional regulator
MTELLDQAIERVRALPPETQDTFARVLLSLADDEAEPVMLTDEERAAIAVSMAAAERGEFASEEEVRAVWAKHGL